VGGEADDGGGGSGDDIGSGIRVSTGGGLGFWSVWSFESFRWVHAGQPFHMKNNFCTSELLKF
jgi:hypothetical protein